MLKTKTIFNLTVGVFLCLTLSTCSEDDDSYYSEINASLAIDREEQLAEIKYNIIETCNYLLYDEIKEAYLIDDQLPVVNQKEAIGLFKNLSKVDGSFFRLKPPNNIAVKFTWYQNQELYMDILIDDPNGCFVKEITFEEAIQVIDIIFNGKDFSGIEGIDFVYK